MISNRYIRDGFGINISHSDDGIVCIDTCGLGLLISFLRSLSNCVTVKTFHSPIPGISRALIHPENSPVGHCHSNQLEFPGNVLFPLPIFILKSIQNFLLITYKFYQLVISPLSRLGFRFATEVPLIPLIAFSISCPVAISKPKRIYRLIACDI